MFSGYYCQLVKTLSWGNGQWS